MPVKHPENALESKKNNDSGFTGIAVGNAEKDEIDRVSKGERKPISSSPFLAPGVHSNGYSLVRNFYLRNKMD